MRNHDSKIYLPRFYHFKFRFHSYFAETFSTVSVKIGHCGDVRCTAARPPKAEVHRRSCYANSSIIPYIAPDRMLAKH
jgi:hypothetical protein